MNFYKIISCLGNRKYEVERLYDGAKREMQIRYANIVRINEYDCQVAKRVSLPYCTPASPSLVFAEIEQGREPLLPIEEAMCDLNDIKDLKVGSIIETNIDDLPFKELYRVESVPITKVVNNVKTVIHDYTLCELNTSQKHTINDEEIKNLSIKTLRKGWKCVERGCLVLKNSSGSYYRYEDASSLVDYNTTLESGQIVYITSCYNFTLVEVANQLGTKYQDVVNLFRNILPKDKNNGVGIDVYKRKQSGNISRIEDVVIDNVEFHRLLQYLRREDAQCKSIVRWKYHTNRKYPKVTPAKYLDYANNPHKELIPHSHLDMEIFKDLIDWLLNKDNFATYKDEYFSFFHLLHWSEQISFIEKIITLHRNGQQQLQDITKLNELVQYPQYVNINVLIVVHTLLKLHQKSDVLTNFDLYSIWKSHLPQKIKSTFGLTLKNYVGTNLFCTCKGAIGFCEENWWLPHRYDYNRPVFHFFNNGRIDVDKRGYSKYDKEKEDEIKPTMEAARDCRAFVLFRDDNNYDVHDCFKQKQVEKEIIKIIQKCSKGKEKDIKSWYDIAELYRLYRDEHSEQWYWCSEEEAVPIIQHLTQLFGLNFNSINETEIGCPVLASIEHDTRHHEALMNKTIDAINKDNANNERAEESQDVNKEVEIHFNTCPLISVPSWRLKWAQKFKDKCTNNNPPQVNKYRLWFNRNTSIKFPFFCEGKEVDKPHKEAGLRYNWCGGNSCFTDIYLSPFADTQTNDNVGWQVNIYTAAIVLRLIADNNHDGKRRFQNFHSSLNWLNSAASHFYCDSCGYILEAGKKQSKHNAHAITWFECQNVECNNKEEIYINHCWNEGCRSIIDSRETSQCPNRKYICPSCGVCCGEGMFIRRRIAGIPIPNKILHFELGEFYCYKCGALMTKQGNTYYCRHHPEVTTTTITNKAKLKKRYDKKS